MPAAAIVNTDRAAGPHRKTITGAGKGAGVEMNRSIGRKRIPGQPAVIGDANQPVQPGDKAGVADQANPGQVGDHPGVGGNPALPAVAGHQHRASGPGDAAVLAVDEGDAGQPLGGTAAHAGIEAVRIRGALIAAESVGLAVLTHHNAVAAVEIDRRKVAAAAYRHLGPGEPAIEGLQYQAIGTGGPGHLRTEDLDAGDVQAHPAVQRDPGVPSVQGATDGAVGAHRVPKVLIQKNHRVEIECNAAHLRHPHAVDIAADDPAAAHRVGGIADGVHAVECVAHPGGLQGPATAVPNADGAAAAHRKAVEGVDEMAGVKVRRGAAGQRGPIETTVVRAADVPVGPHNEGGRAGKLDVVQVDCDPQIAGNPALSAVGGDVDRSPGADHRAVIGGEEAGPVEIGIGADVHRGESQPGLHAVAAHRHAVRRSGGVVIKLNIGRFRPDRSGQEGDRHFQAAGGRNARAERIGNKIAAGG